MLRRDVFCERVVPMLWPHKVLLLLRLPPLLLLQAMRRGFKFLQGWSMLLEGFTPQQRRVLVSGMEDFGADAVVRILVFEGWEDVKAEGGAGAPTTIDCLHQALHRFEAEDKRTADRQTGGSRPSSLLRRFVRFATGRNAITQNMTITLRRHGDKLAFPEASTCVSELRMPDYRDAKLLYQRLRLAICSRGAMADF